MLLDCFFLFVCVCVCVSRRGNNHLNRACWEPLIHQDLREVDLVVVVVAFLVVVSAVVLMLLICLRICFRVPAVVEDAVRAEDFQAEEGVALILILVVEAEDFLVAGLVEEVASLVVEVGAEGSLKNYSQREVQLFA